ncbi:restriction endonuclease subunit S [Pseudoalteromonas sp. P1-11]|uniref:restriction endonuclease subunit S n=1 Tax=Pseudoalteromonas sp. P1-11 TaxID=1715254 RepID=UPI0006E4BB1D|nr:restriction endonuclease subunit S [Pseudoalteromonas sp. P1-11]KPW01825.1 Type I restriction modification DNA specificity domain protein [Pseudoalteromonas sp. P1-11]
MGSNWVDCELGDFIELKRGYDLPKTKRVNGGVPVVSSSGTSGEHNEVRVKAPGVVTGRYGTIGEVFYIEDDFWPLNTTLYVRDFKGNDPLYVYYFLKTIRYSDYTDKGAVPGINRNHIHKAKVKVPVNPIHQRSLALRLFDLDRKIELNQKTNQTLEQMAQALFKSWFVDFDPVFDNLLASVDFKLENLETSLPDELKHKVQRRLAALNSLENAAECKASLIALAQELQAQRPKKEATQSAVQAAETTVKASLNTNPNILAQHANTHAHFPNEFEHNEQLGWIPKGWEDVKVNEMVRTVSETYPLKSVDKVIFLNTGDILEGKFLHSEFSNTEGLPGQAKKSIKKGDILYSEIRPKNKRFALVNFDGSEHVVSTKLMVLRPNEGFEELFPYFVLTQEHNISLLQQAAESRSGTFPQITFTELAMIKIALPKDKKLINIFISSFLKDHFAQKDKRDFQNKTLTKLRDTLLPKLISGELQILDVATDEKIVD